MHRPSACPLAGGRIPEPCRAPCPASSMRLPYTATICHRHVRGFVGFCRVSTLVGGRVSTPPLQPPPLRLPLLAQECGFDQVAPLLKHIHVEMLPDEHYEVLALSVEQVSCVRRIRSSPLQSHTHTHHSSLTTRVHTTRHTALICWCLLHLVACAVCCSGTPLAARHGLRPLQLSHVLWMCPQSRRRW